MSVAAVHILTNMAAFLSKRFFHRLTTRISARSLSASSFRHDKKSSLDSKKVKDDVEVAIIGGGCIGASIAYHLAKQGMKDVVLLEKTELTAGSTWHAAGLTTSYHPAPRVKRLHLYSLNLYSQLEKETGQNIGFHRPGSIRLLSSSERLKEAKYVVQRSGCHPNPLWMLSLEEVHQHVPFMNMDGVLGGLWTPGDGHIDPYSLTHALALGARKYGAEIYLSSPVLSLSQESNGRWRVETPHGSINAKHIINAAGFWGREIGKLVGADHPLIPVHHQYFITKDIPEVMATKKEMPVLRDLEGSYYIRQERNGLLIGPYEKAEKMRLQTEWWDGVTPGFGKELFESDLDRIMEHVETAMKRFPCAQNAEISSIISGPITYTPDILPMAGPMPEIRNYWCAIGFGYGVVHAGGVGKYLADWIMNGEPPYDLIEFDPGRYGHWTTKDYVFAKCRESYGFNNLLYYPKEERYAGRPVRTSPLYEELKAAGAQYTFSSGWEVAKWYAQDGVGGYKPSYYRTNWFEPLRREVQNVLDNVSIADISAFAKIDVKGKNAKKFLDYVVANKLPKVGATNVSHMITPSGKVYAEVTVSTLADDHFFIVTGSGSEYHDLRWLQEYARSYDDVHILNNTGHVATLSINGPKSRDLLQKLTNEDVSPEGFKFMSNRRMEVAGIPVFAMRVSYTGELGWEFYVENERAVELYKALRDAGEEFNVGHIGSYAINSMRIEKGFRLWGNEMNMNTTPFEAGLDFFIKLNKGNFLGRGALVNEKRVLGDKRLVCMIVDTENVDAEGDETIWFGGKSVGSTTSGCYGYQVEKSIAYGYLPIFLTDPGTTVQVELMGKQCNATVVREPLVQIEAARSKMKN